MGNIRVIQVGLGPLGRKMIEFMLQRTGIEVVGAVDKSADLAGKSLREICGASAPELTVKSSVAEVLATAKADAVLLTTVSDMERITPQVKEIVALGLPVVSTCEELSYPWETSPQLAKAIDQAATKAGVAVVGTGVNPGFLMDFLPLAMTAICQDVEKIRVERIQDATFRRIPFQKKIGAGLTLKEFEAKKQAGTLRHVGLTESMQMIAARMGWKLSRTEDLLTPIIAEKSITAPAMTIKSGDAAGVQQIGRGFVDGKERITLCFRAAIGEPDTHDSIEISGSPSFTSRIEGGINGDIATCAITINAVKQILRVSPGLKTMADIPAVSFFS